MNAFATAIPLISKVKSPEGTLQTQEFLEVCNQVLPIVAKLGTGFALVKSDVGGNIDRLGTRAATRPDAYSPDIFDMIRDEVADGSHTGSSSCTKGLLWLKRAMQFIVALLVKLEVDRQMTLSQAASETYYATLQHYHGWIVTGTFTVALKLVPSRQVFMESMECEGESEEAVMAAMKQFCEGFGALLTEVHTFLVDNGLDDPAKPAESSDFLPSLTTAFMALDVNQPLPTKAFTEACTKVMPIFDHIGTVFLIAKHEFEVKTQTVAKVAEQHSLLDDVVTAGKADKSITVKNSPARNLHRLLNTLAFISAIFKGLQANKTLKDAVSDAYDATLGQLHTWVVRAGIKTGMLGLPSREAFFSSIGETQDTAAQHAEGFTVAADAIVTAVEKLYLGVEMPRSDFSVKSLWS